MTLVLDSGAFLSAERGNRELIAMAKRERLAGKVAITHGGVIGQVWRGGSGRQANVSRLLAEVKVEALDERLGRQAGVLLALSQTSDVIDAAVVALAVDGDSVVTSDPGDLAVLADAADLHIDVVPI